MLSQRMSVVIPALNEAAHLTDLLCDLESIRRQGHEVILSDGGSSDQTKTLASGRVDRVIEAPRGRASQMNAGAEATNADVIWFVHADTRVPAGAPRELLDACKRGAQWGRFDVRLSGEDPRFRIIERMINLRSRLSGIATGDQGIFVNRHTFESVGGFPDQPLMEDIALSRALKRRVRPACLSSKLVTSSRRWEEKGVWHTVFLMWRLRLAYALGRDPATLAREYNHGS
jgi:rSAM/selenodomain-associated transferase 2